MNLPIFRQSKVLTNLNRSLADELNQPTSFPTARSNKKSENPNKTPNTQWVGLFKKHGFF